MDGDYGWTSLKPCLISKLHKKLCECEKLRLGELLARPGTTPIPVEDLPGAARRRLEETGHDDLETIWHLRFGGKPRLWGIIDGSVFYVMLWDPDHLFCPSEKSHT